MFKTYTNTTSYLTFFFFPKNSSPDKVTLKTPKQKRNKPIQMTYTYSDLDVHVTTNIWTSKPMIDNTTEEKFYGIDLEVIKH